LNEQVKWEFYSGYLYLSMSAYFHNAGLPGFAHWMRLQAQEELQHAVKFYDFLLEHGEAVRLAAVDAPAASWKNPLDVFEKTLEHERGVTARINKLATLARKEGDFSVEIFLHWFITEQVEEEASVNDVLSRLKLIKGEGHGLFLLDKELGARVLTSAGD
jgi:ferritin